MEVKVDNTNTFVLFNSLFNSLLTINHFNSPITINH